MATVQQHLRLNARAAVSRSDGLLRDGRVLRFERGGNVYASDGRLGSLRQVVVDEQTSRILALAVHIERLGECVLVSPLAVKKTGGSAVFLNGTLRQFEEWLPQAPRHQPQRATRANLKLLSLARPGASDDHRVAILAAGKDFLETGNPATASAASEQNW